MSTQNFYEILKSTPTASLEELRRNYKQLILQCHPDKLQNDNSNTTITTTTSTNLDNATNRTGDAAACIVAATVDTNVEIPTTTSLGQCDREFVAINEAWTTLKDPIKRRLYDAELMLTKFQAHSNIFARLTLADMKRCAGTSAITTTHSGTDNDCNVGECEGDRKEGDTYWYYTYDCRCGGQYIVDESADSEILRSNHNSTANDQRQSQSAKAEQKAQEKQMSHDNDIDKQSSQAAAGNGGGGVLNASAPICGSNRNSETTSVDEDILNAADDDYGDSDGDGDDGEVLVECSECSLVIIVLT